MESTSVVAIARGRRLARSGTGRMIRQNADVSLRQLAAELPVTPGTLSRWERGERLPRGPYAARYAEVLELLAKEG